jgi:RND family efflux transporter MFP subunit
LLAVAATLVLTGCDSRNTYRPPPPAEVTVAPPTARRITRYLELTGSASAVAKVDLVARVQGFLESVGFADGANVKKGDTLFVIEQAPYKASLDNAKAAQAAQEALLVQADQDLKRQTTLVQKDAASESTLESSRAKRDSTAAALDQAKAQVQQAQINFDYTLVKAPFDGLVSARLADPGALVGAGGPTKLGTIVAIDPVYVTFNMDELQVLQIRRALHDRGLTLKDLGPVTVEAGLQTEAGYPHQGTIDYVAPSLDTGTGTLQVRAVFANKDRLFIPGLFVRVRVPVQRNVDALLVPDAALGTNQQGRYVLLVDEKNVVVQRQVEAGERIDGGLRMITAGLAASDRVVVAGVQRAIPGNTVAPVAAPAQDAKAAP